jgi:hypothetical protein
MGARCGHFRLLQEQRALSNEPSRSRYAFRQFFGRLPRFGNDGPGFNFKAPTLVHWHGYLPHQFSIAEYIPEDCRALTYVTAASAGVSSGSFAAENRLGNFIGINSHANGMTTLLVDEPAVCN